MACDITLKRLDSSICLVNQLAKLPEPIFHDFDVSLGCLIELGYYRSNLAFYLVERCLLTCSGLNSSVECDSRDSDYDDRNRERKPAAHGLPRYVDVLTEVGILKVTGFSRAVLLVLSSITLLGAGVLLVLIGDSLGALFVGVGLGDGLTFLIAFLDDFLRGNSLPLDHGVFVHRLFPTDLVQSSEKNLQINRLN
jgi:hypothetical protein